MGRQPVAGSVDEHSGEKPEIEESVSVGEHSPETFALLLLDRVAAQASGVRTVRHDDNERNVCIVGGMPVAVLTTLPEETTTTWLQTSKTRKHCQRF